MTACNWFNPYDSPKIDASFKAATYFLHVDNDSTVCFISNSISLHNPSQAVLQDLCVQVSSEGDLEPITSCLQMQSDTTSVWLNTAGLSGLTAGDSIRLLIESPEFDEITGSTVVPEQPIVTGYNMTARSLVSGNKVFDEFQIQFSDPSPSSDGYMLQLVRSVDTIGASPPTLLNMKTNDLNLQVRKFGRSVLDNALLFDDTHWDDGHYNAEFRTRNSIDEGVPYHYTVIISGISLEMLDFFYDLENGDFYGTFSGGSENFIRSNLTGAQGCFGAMKTKTILIFP
jgi:hypothetical protein